MNQETLDILIKTCASISIIFSIPFFIYGLFSFNGFRYFITGRLNRQHYGLFFSLLISFVFSLTLIVLNSFILSDKSDHNIDSIGMSLNTLFYFILLISVSSLYINNSIFNFLLFVVFVLFILNFFTSIYTIQNKNDEN